MRLPSLRPVVLIASASLAAFVAAPVSARPSTVNADQSSNWSGYGVNLADYPLGTTFTAITGEWVVPKVTQKTKKQAEDSSTWIGIGGNTTLPDQPVGSPTLIQTGTEQSISKTGKATYDAWWEIIPEPETEIPALVVRPGNVMRATIGQGSLPADWTITITDLSRTHDSFTTTTTYPSTMDTAEWINEAPTEFGTSAGLARMPAMAPVAFGDSTLNGKRVKLTRSDEIQMIASNGVVIGQPSAPGKAGSDFNVCVYPAKGKTCKAPAAPPR